MFSCFTLTGMYLCGIQLSAEIFMDKIS